MVPSGNGDNLWQTRARNSNIVCRSIADNSTQVNSNQNQNDTFTFLTAARTTMMNTIQPADQQGLDIGLRQGLDIGRQQGMGVAFRQDTHNGRTRYLPYQYHYEYQDQHQQGYRQGFDNGTEFKYQRERNEMFQFYINIEEKSYRKTKKS